MLHKVPSLLIVLVLGLLVFTLNYILPSDINNWYQGLNFSLDPLYEYGLFAEEVEWRYTNSEFGRRPLMVNLIRYGVWTTGWSHIIVFIFLQLAGYVLSTAVILRLSRQLAPGASAAASYLPFLLLYPQVFLFVAHAHTFDDLYQYLALVLTLLALVQRRFVVGWLSLLAACLIRETSILYLPVVFYLLYRLAGWRVLPAGLYVLTAATVSAALLWLYLPIDQLEATAAYARQRRFMHWIINFGTPARFSESLWLPVFILGPFVLLLWRHWQEVTRRSVHRYFAHGFIFLAVVNTVLVWIAAITAEARLLMLPVFLALPILAPVWDTLAHRLHTLPTYWQRRDWWLLLGTVLLVQLLYHPTVGGTAYAFRAYAVGWTVVMYVGWRLQTTLDPAPRLLR